MIPSSPITRKNDYCTTQNSQKFFIVLRPGNLIKTINYLILPRFRTGWCFAFRGLFHLFFSSFRDSNFNISDRNHFLLHQKQRSRFCLWKPLFVKLLASINEVSSMSNTTAVWRGGTCLVAGEKLMLSLLPMLLLVKYLNNFYVWQSWSQLPFLELEIKIPVLLLFSKP